LTHAEICIEGFIDSSPAETIRSAKAEAAQALANRVKVRWCYLYQAASILRVTASISAIPDSKKEETLSKLSTATRAVLEQYSRAGSSNDQTSTEGQAGFREFQAPANDSRLRSGSHDPKGQVRCAKGTIFFAGFSSSTAILIWQSEDKPQPLSGKLVFN
jgi:hypothetical protein